MQDCLSHIETATLDSVSLIRRLQAEFHPNTTPVMKPVPCQLYKLVSKAWHQALPRWKVAAIQPECEIHFGPDPTLIIDPSILRQILVNLFANSLYALEIRFFEQPESRPLIEVALDEREEYAILELKDHGTGMSPNVLEKCKESFFSTKGERGSGLALHMVCRSIQNLGGAIEMTSTLGEGTSIFITLPKIGAQ